MFVQVLTEEPCFYTAKAAEDKTKVAFLSMDFLTSIIEHYPQVIFRIFYLISLESQ